MGLPPLDFREDPQTGPAGKVVILDPVWTLFWGVPYDEVTCSTEREEDILEPDRLLVGDVSARKARLVVIGDDDAGWSNHDDGDDDNDDDDNMVFEAINKMIVMIAHLDVDLSISLPHTSPSPFAVIKALVQEYDK